jgi:hypothetical protein
MNILNQLRANPSRVLHIDTPLGLAITGGNAYLSRTGQSVAVTLYGPRDPRHPDVVRGPHHRVYLPVAHIEGATEPRHLLNAASHKAQRWLDDVRNDYWYALVVIECRALREKHRSALKAIALVAHRLYGDKYWRHPGARDLLRRELSRLGITCPPDGAAIEFLPLAHTT